MALEQFRSTLIKLDKANQFALDTQFAKQGDANGRVLFVQLSNAGIVEDQTGVELNLKWRNVIKGNEGYDSFTVEDAAQGLYKFVYPTAMTSVPGPLDCEIEIVENGTLTNTRKFRITVEGSSVSNEAAESSNSFTALQDAVLKVNKLEENYAPRLNEVTAKLADITALLPEINKPYRIAMITDTHIGKDGETYQINAIHQFVEQVNTIKPNMAIHLGDICDTTDYYSLFNQAWSGIDGTHKTTLIGNHEFDMFTNDEKLQDYLGYRGKSINGGSKFNQTFVLSTYALPVRIILLDTNFNSNNQRERIYNRNMLHSETLSWFESVIENATEDVILVFCHSGPHLYEGGYFASSQQALALRDIVDNKANDNPKLNLKWFFGHHHGGEIQVYNNLGDNNIGYRIPTSLEGANGRMVTVTINPNRTIELTKSELGSLPLYYSEGIENKTWESKVIHLSGITFAEKRLNSLYIETERGVETTPAASIGFQTFEKINLSSVNTLFVDWMNDGVEDNGHDSLFAITTDDISLSTGFTDIRDNKAVKKILNISRFNRITNQIDVSDLTGDYYISVINRSFRLNPIKNTSKLSIFNVYGQ